MRGIRTDGLRTVQDLMDRCRVDDETGCWIWSYGRDPNGRPTTWLPEQGRRVSLGVAIGFLKTGLAPEKGVVWHCICTTTNCANPKHRRAGNRSSQMLAAKLTRSPLAKAYIAATKRRTSKLSDESAAAIRASDEILKVLAERYGVSISMCSLIRRQVRRRPLAAAGSSVFNFGG